MSKIGEKFRILNSKTYWYRSYQKKILQYMSIFGFYKQTFKIGNIMMDSKILKITLENLIIKTESL